MLRRVQSTMKRVFENMCDCVKDGVISACGAFDSTSLKRIFETLQLREESFYNHRMFVVTFHVHLRSPRANALRHTDHACSICKLCFNGWKCPVIQRAFLWC